MKFGEQLAALRKHRTMTQEDLAGQLMVTRQTISSWEREKSFPDLTMLLQLSKVFDTSLDQLLKSDSQLEEKLKKQTVQHWLEPMYWFAGINSVLFATGLLIFALFRQSGLSMIGILFGLVGFINAGVFFGLQMLRGQLAGRFVVDLKQRERLLLVVSGLLLTVAIGTLLLWRVTVAALFVGLFVGEVTIWAVIHTFRRQWRA